MGAQSMLIYYQQADLIVIVLSNTGNISPDELAFALRQAPPGRPNLTQGNGDNPNQTH
jgi:hypothetical protein